VEAPEFFALAVVVPAVVGKLRDHAGDDAGMLGADLCLVQIQRSLPALDVGQVGVGNLKIGDDPFKHIPVFAERGLPRVCERDFDW